MSPKRESMLNRSLFNRHALPEEVKEVVMPIAKISDFIHEGDSPTKRSSQLTNTGRQAMKKSRTEVTSPSAADKTTQGTSSPRHNDSDITSGKRDGYTSSSKVDPSSFAIKYE